MKNSTTSFNNEEFIRRQKVEGADAYYGSLSDKSITQGKVECSVKVFPTDCLSNFSANVEIIWLNFVIVHLYKWPFFFFFFFYFFKILQVYLQAIQTALQRLEEGCSIEDAKAVCEPEILWQIFKWKVEASSTKILMILLMRFMPLRCTWLLSSVSHIILVEMLLMVNPFLLCNILWWQMIDFKWSSL